MPTTPKKTRRLAAAPPTIKPGAFLKRLVSWAALWIVALLLVYSGWQTGCWMLIAFFGLAGQWEFYLAQEEKGHKVFKQSGLFCGALLFLNSWFFLIHDPRHAGWFPYGQELILAFAVLGAFVRLVIRQEEHHAPITTTALALLGLMYVPFLFNFVAAIAFAPGMPEQDRFFLIYLLAVTKFSDVGAYVFGSLFGRHKMIPRISPGKTWEGFAGGIIVPLGISIALAYYVAPHMNRNPAAILDGTELPQPTGATYLLAPVLSLKSAILLGILLPLASVVGDLAESVIKRDASIKDSGHSIPGIGGALDLIDSILFTAPVLYFYLQFTATW